MKLTIIGCSGSFPGPDSPSSCYLVEADGYRVLLDLGNGALGYLARHIDIKDVNAVLLSHLHVDHCIDLCSMYVARTYHPSGQLPRLPVYGPEGTAQRLAAAYDLDPQPGMTLVYDFIDWHSDRDYEIGPLRVTVAPVAHPVPSFAMRIEHDGKTLVYSGDTGPCDALVELSTQADLLLCEAGFREGHPYPSDVHLTGFEAGQHATRAGVGRLVLTHIQPWYGVGESLDGARRAYQGAVDAAVSGASFDI